MPEPIRDEAAGRADRLVAAYILRAFHSDYDRMTYRQGFYRHAAEMHLARCPTMRLTEHEATGGFYGCETGCDYSRFTATIVCGCGRSVDYEYGEFGELADIIADLIEEDKRG